MDSLKGLGVAMVTPFNAEGSVDYKGLENLTNHLIEGEVDYLVVQGTTGESVTLTAEEKKTIHEFVHEIAAGRVPVVLGVGGNNTRAVCALFDFFDFSKVDAILSVSPAYNKPTQEGIYQHFKAVSAASPVPIILYNVPSRTGSNMTAATTLRLARDFDNVVAVKEASGDLGQMGDIIANCPDDFLVLSGDDALAVPMLAIGGQGLISVAGNAFPTEWADLVHATMHNDCQSAAQLHHRFANFVPMLFREGNPGGVKAALKRLQICGDSMRLPLWPVSDQLRAEIEAEVDKLVEARDC